MIITKEMKSTERRILCLKGDSSFFIFVLAQNRIERFFVREYSYCVGDIYVGRVCKKLDGIGGLFVEFCDKETGFLPLEKTKGIRSLNRNSEVLKCEDLLLVQVRKYPLGDKRPMLSCHMKGISQVKRDELREKGKHSYAGTKLYKNKDSFTVYLEKHPLNEKDRVFCLTKEEAAFLWEYDNIQENYDNTERLIYNDPRISLFELYGLKNKIADLFERKVLTNEGYNLVIDYAEAFTIIDVNSSHYNKNESKEEAVFSINRQAAREIINQIQSRSISGMILIDFINMTVDEHKNMLIEELDEMGQNLYPKLRVLDLTMLGIIECIREKTTPTIETYRGQINKTILMK